MPHTRITVTLPPDLVRRADRLAHRRRALRSDVLAGALAAHLAREGGSHRGQPPTGDPRIGCAHVEQQILRLPSVETADR